MKLPSQNAVLGRRAFLNRTTLVLLATGSAGASCLTAGEGEPLRIGLITDLHYADKPSAGSRHYRQTLTKLDEAAEYFQQQRPAFIVELGDLIDAADSVSTELDYLKTVNRRFAAICPQRHYVLGNHCVDTLYKREFLDEVGQEKSYYDFDAGGFRFVVLDACFGSDGQPYGRKNSHWADANIPSEQLDWLRETLSSSDEPAIIFAHQRLDVDTQHGVRNNRAVREILEASQKVLAVFQGHSHQNDLRDIGGIHYCTLVAMVEGSGAESNGYSLLELDSDRTLRLTGFRQQHSYTWTR